MPHRVDLAPGVRDQLMLAWLAARDKKAVTMSYDRLEANLRRDPWSVGKHLAEGLWLAASSPLRVYYEISEKDLVVTITEIELAE
jgi:hypothetical protein